ncbi:hypothetical protein [Capnocytophaga gingivalis]|uniref:hypothetical protein n=1 Tax=Capnocytophaga gingivalis TaxID=1017 RepID=UPI00288B0E9C|nr:hypothetical protein [Capnocytophaga gingivalis]
MKEFLFLPALLVGIFFAAFFIFLVNEFSTSLYSEVWLLFFPIPLILGIWLFYAIYYKQIILSLGAIGCSIAFFAWIMKELNVSFSKLSSEKNLPITYQNYEDLDYEVSVCAQEKGHCIHEVPTNESEDLTSCFLNHLNEVVMVQDDRMSSYIVKFDTLGYQQSIEVPTDDDHRKVAYIVDDYIINIADNTYSSFFLNDDEDFLPMTFVEASKNWTKEEQQTYFENNVKTKATCFKIVKRKKSKVFFLKDDKWQYFYTDLGKETLKTQYNYPELFDEKRFPIQERSLKRTYIHPQYVQTYQDNYGYTTILYYHIIKPFLTYHLKTRFETVKSQKELSALPTYYFKNDTETIEVFGSMRLYSHKHLQYQLLRIGKKTYRVGK